MVQELNLLSVNLATVAMESWLYGIFFVLSTTSTYLLIRRGQELNKSHGGSSSRPVWRTPMFMAGALIFLSVTGVSTIDLVQPTHRRANWPLREALDLDRHSPVRRLHQLQGGNRAYHCVRRPLDDH